MKPLRKVRTLGAALALAVFAAAASASAQTTTISFACAFDQKLAKYPTVSSTISYYQRLCTARLQFRNYANQQTITKVVGCTTKRNANGYQSCSKTFTPAQIGVPAGYGFVGHSADPQDTMLELVYFRCLYPSGSPDLSAISGMDSSGNVSMGLYVTHKLQCEL